MTEPAKTAFRIGDAQYEIALSKIPYLSSFVGFQDKAGQKQAEYVHGPIPLFDVAYKGIEKGYRQCFRSLGPNLSEYHTLCETYNFLGVDVLGGKSLDDIARGLKQCKNEYEVEYKSYQTIKGDKSAARDTAFQLLYLIVRGEFEDGNKDSNKVFNAVLFIVSHAATFKWRTRAVLRAACEERFVLSAKQIGRLQQWEKEEAVKQAEDERGDVTTEEEVMSDYSWNSWDS
jgi:hypothetical protein